MKILIVEDNMDISNMLKELLRINKYQITCAYSGTEALMLLEREKVDLILLDLMLPGLSGEEVLRSVRQSSYVPIICVSAKEDQNSKVQLLKLGADDYVTKPFDNEELLARIEAQLRRNQAFVGSPQSVQILEYREMQLDTEAVTVTLKGAPLLLTKREFLILEMMMKYPKKVFTKSNIYKHVWNEEFYGDENTVNVHISNLRHKIKEIDQAAEYIQTVWGIGFKMADEI
jgi:Response regulators consisting of a CheY-like receiver domain and a winged-helix DNA-binding domain